MSLLSRWFRKAPSSSPASAPRAAPAPLKAAPKPSAEARAQTTAAEERALQAAIAAGDGQAVARWLIEGSSTTIRQAAAQAIEDPELLQKLIREVRGGNDKTVYKILSAKREVQVEQARKQERLHAEITSVAQALERHSRLPYDALYAPTLEVLERDWQVLAEHADPSLREQASQSLNKARETVAEQTRLRAEQAAREQAEAEAKHQRELEKQAAAEAAAERAREQAEQQRVLAEQHAVEQEAESQITDLIRKVRGALRDGNTARANSVRRALDEHLAGATPPAGLAGQIQQLDQQLRELQDWKQFSVAPKRAELIEQMEALIGSSLEPLALGEKIKALQDAWRGLSKGAGEDLEAEWQRFHAASQQAYQPCSEYHAAQAVIRQENLQHRAAVLTKLEAAEAALTGERPAWRGLIRALREAKPEWYRHSPVERKAGRVQQEAFAAITGRLQARLDAEYARNTQQKESLIVRAQALLASEDDRQAIAEIKALQQQWQAVGPVAHEVDQRLWASFRQHCDAVFQKRQQTAAAHVAELEGKKAQAVALCEQVEQIAALDGAELLTRMAGLAEIRTVFDALGELPRAESRELRQRFERAVERCQSAQMRERAREAERAWDHLFEAAMPVRAYQLAVARGQDAETLERLKAAAESALAAVLRWPKGAQEALRQTLAQAPNPDLTANETALRILCIRAELLANTETPPEDQALRRDYQLQRLAQRMGQGASAEDARFETLVLDWVRVGPVEESVHGPLLQRFRRCKPVSSERKR